MDNLTPVLVSVEYGSLGIGVGNIRILEYFVTMVSLILLCSLYYLYSVKYWYPVIGSSLVKVSVHGIGVNLCQAMLEK